MMLQMIQHRILCLTGSVLVVLLAACATKSPIRSLEEGKLRLCPKSPNCVSSESTVEMTTIKPIAYVGDSAKALEIMKQTLLFMGAHVEREESDYLWVTFRSMILRFTDDVEVHLVPEESLLHIRSGSRVGYSDMGANRERVEHIRQHFNEKK